MLEQILQDKERECEQLESEGQANKSLVSALKDKVRSLTLVAEV